MAGFFLAFLLFSCAGSAMRYPQVYSGEIVPEILGENFSSNYSSLPFPQYQFQNSKILSRSMQAKLQLQPDKNIQYVLFAQFYRNFIAATQGKDRLYLVGSRRTVTEETFQTQEEYYDLLLIVEKGRGQSVSSKASRYSHYSLGILQQQIGEGRENSQILKNFFLSVKDFSGDNLDDIFLGFELSRRGGRYQYYLYQFSGGNLKAIVQPWGNFSENDHQRGIDKDFSPFMRELSADIYPAFVAEIELEFNYKINIDLSPLADDLIRDKVYSKQGLVLEKRGIPHLGFNPILFPVRYGRFGRIRSVQQVRSRYGQIGIFVCNWFFREGRWLPDEVSMEFLAKPRV